MKFRRRYSEPAVFFFSLRFPQRFLLPDVIPLKSAGIIKKMINGWRVRSRDKKDWVWCLQLTLSKFVYLIVYCSYYVSREREEWMDGSKKLVCCLLFIDIILCVSIIVIYSYIHDLPFVCTFQCLTSKRR